MATEPDAAARLTACRSSDASAAEPGRGREAGLREGERVSEAMRLEVAGVFLRLSYGGVTMADSRERELLLHAPWLPDAGEIVLLGAHRLRVVEVEHVEAQPPLVHVEAL